MDTPAKTIELVEGGEVGMARRIALAYTVMRPVSLWTAAIPGKFLYDAVMREREIRWSRARYLPPRRQAMKDAAERAGRSASTPERSSEDLSAARRLADRLTQHYARALAAEGQTYGDLLRAAFPGSVDLELEWQEIGEIEAEVDEEALRLRPRDDKLARRLELYRSAAQEQRQRLVRELYYE